jgi:hypothetical protein
MKKNGIEMDYGKRERTIFLDRERHYHKWDRYIKWLLIVMILYFGFHIYNAMAQSTPIIINQPDGGQKVCVVDGRYITCF